MADQHGPDDHRQSSAIRDASTRARQSARSTITGAWSEAPVPARSSRSMNAPVTRPASDGRAEHEVDPHAAVPLEALPVVVPVGVDVRPRRVRPHHVGVPGVEEAWNAARSGGVTWVSLANTAMSKTSSSCGAMFQSPTRAVSLAQPVAGGVAQPAEPVELVDVVRVVDLAAVGHVERPDPYAAARRARSPAPRRPPGRRSPASPRSRAGRPRGRPGRRSRRRSTGCGRARRPRSPSPAGPSAGTGRRGPWSPAGRARRCRGAGGTPRRGRSGSGGS